MEYSLTYFQSFILGIVEGLTEFLPVSSTGHMILTSSILDIKIDDFVRSFLIIIQLGSILAVVFLFWNKLIKNINIWFKIIIGFVPTGIIGLLASKFIDSFFNAIVVAFMLIIGGVIFIIIEIKYKNKYYKIDSIDKINLKQAFLIGACQCFAILPGTSRSGASIIGGLVLGLDRKTAAEFSFLLAIPTMFAATFYDIYKNIDTISNQQNSIITILIGFLVAFVIAIFVIKFFLKFISRFNFIPFGIYRIALGLIFLYVYFSGIIKLEYFNL